MKKEEKKGTRACPRNYFSHLASCKRSQVTIFIIIAVLIVIAAILIYMFYPGISTTLGFGEESPSQFFQSCLEDDIKISVDTLSPQGGSINPEHYTLYNSEKVEYLCYTSEYYKTCVMQQPMLKRHIESEIENEMSEKVTICLNELENSYKKKGYEVNLKRGELSVELIPKRVVATSNSSLILTKGETKKYETFNIVLNNNLYELISIANSILNWEAEYGDAETTVYMNYYHDLKVEKNKLSDGTTIYILTDRNTGNKFQFATRSVAWPPGYG